MLTGIFKVQIQILYYNYILKLVNKIIHLRPKLKSIRFHVKLYVGRKCPKLI